MSILSLANVIAVVEGVEKIGNNKYLGRCPHPDHPDLHPSFAIDLGDNGDAVFECQSRHCDRDAIVAELKGRIRRDGLDIKPAPRMPTLKPKPLQQRRPKVSETEVAAWCTRLQSSVKDPFSPIAEYFDLRGIYPSTLQEMKVGIRKHKLRHAGTKAERGDCEECNRERDVVTIPLYRNGELRGVKYRAIEVTDGHKWSQELGSGDCKFLYGIGHRADLSSDVVFVVEGEHEFMLLHSL